MRGNADQQNKPMKYKSKVSGNAKEKHMVTQIANCPQQGRPGMLVE